jgi:hypothetical protein
MNLADPCGFRVAKFSLGFATFITIRLVAQLVMTIDYNYYTTKLKWASCPTKVIQLRTRVPGSRVLDLVARSKSSNKTGLVIQL